MLAALKVVTTPFSKNVFAPVMFELVGKARPEWRMISIKERGYAQQRHDTVKVYSEELAYVDLIGVCGTAGGLHAEASEVWLTDRYTRR